MLGGLDTHDRAMRELAERGEFVVAGVDYRLAPEADFIEMRSDIIAVTQYLQDRAATLGLDSHRMAIAGDSAGAHLSICVANHEKFRLTLRSLTLIYGAYGLQDSVSRRLISGEESGLDENALRSARKRVLGKSLELDSIDFDVLRQDLSGLPPTLVTSCALDPLKDDSVALTAMLSSAGVRNEYVEVAGVLHGYLHYSRKMQASRRLLQLAADFIRKNF